MYIYVYIFTHMYMLFVRRCRRWLLHQIRWKLSYLGRSWVAVEANSVEEASPFGRTEVGRGRAVGARGSCLRVCLFLCLKGHVFLCCCGTLYILVFMCVSVFCVFCLLVCLVCVCVSVFLAVCQDCLEQSICLCCLVSFLF